MDAETLSEKTISSSLTFIQKVIVPTVWLLAYPIAISLFWARSEFSKGDHFAWVAAASLWAPAWLLGLGLMAWRCLPLKRVRLTAAGLLVSNYRREISIPFSSILEISERRLLSPRLVQIKLGIDSAFGAEISFMPAIEILFVRKPHSIVAELAARIRAVH